MTAGDQIDIGSVAGEAIAIGRDARAQINNYGDNIFHIDRMDKLEDQPPKPGEPPYKGLAYFTETDADIFFGREEISEDLAARLQKTGFLAVVGASGSGKSSLLRAGIIPRLRQKNWLIHIFTPTSDPLGQLANVLTSDEKSLSAADELRAQLLESPETLRRAAEKLAARADASQLLIIIDQFEEIFTQNRNEVERRAFLDNLLAAASSGSSINIIIGLRADFIGHLAEPEALRALVQEYLVLLGPIRQKDLVCVIMEPACMGDWEYVEGLVEQIVTDVGQEPGRLPLLSHALLETWKRRAAHVMTLKGYREAGGVEGAIAKTADDTWRRLGNDKKRAIMKAIFLKLTELGEGAENTRRIASRQNLLRIDGGEGDVNDVIEDLVQARLITIDNDQVQVAHEALIRGWPRLQDWITDDRERISFSRRLTRAAQEWEDNKLDADYLFRGSQLAQAESRIDEYKEWELSEQQSVFIRASQEAAVEAARQLEQLEEAGRQKALLATIYALIGGGIGLGIAALLLFVSGYLDFLPILYIVFSIGVGALAGLIYVPTFDRIVSGIEQRSKIVSWFAGALVGMFAFGLVIAWLANISVSLWQGILLGGAWGTAAGAGRLWIQGSDLSRRLTIPLIGIVSGLTLVVTYLGLSTGWLDESLGLVFIIGVLVPLIILVAEDLAITSSAGGRDDQI